MKYIKYFFILILVISVSSCKKFLDTKPTDFLAPETYYSTEDQLNNALMGVYDPLGWETMYGNNLFANLTICTDESFWNRAAQTTGTQVNVFDYSNIDVANLWAACYTGIERANMLIANVKKPQMDEAKRENILGQAMFLRGYYYFLLATNFGGVPLKTVPQPSVSNPVYINVPRSSIKDLYTQILSDMTEAEGKLNTITVNGNPGYISKTACQGILARVNLNMAGFPLNETARFAEALSWAKKVEASGEQTLNTAYNSSLTNSAYSQIFINQMRDEYNIKESIWEVEFYGNRISDAFVESGRLGNTIGLAFSPSVDSPDSLGYSYGFANTTRRHYLRYDNADQRRDWAIAPFRYNNTAPYARVNWTASTIYNRNVGKWRRSFEKLTPKNKNYTPTNFPLLRYSDVLLMIAEAENEVNGPTTTAYNALNQVRRRAYGVSLAAASPTADAPAAMGKDNFRTFIQEERSRELCYEGLRKYDLIRWGIYVARMNEIGNEMANDPTNTAFKWGGLGGQSVSEKNVLLPIPSTEMSVNKAITAKDQNPGW
ncbi:MAG: RagB/SusD family nutrient uptake outer membrane protein [Sphingobacteriales bacterium]|jgi:hypothetical protein|nr:RagB/SusD family nutrient uptake outer membrane protein [Sphingobacteriales bacterium]